MPLGIGRRSVVVACQTTWSLMPFLDTAIIVLPPNLRIIPSHNANVVLPSNCILSTHSLNHCTSSNLSISSRFPTFSDTPNVVLPPNSASPSFRFSTVVSPPIFVSYPGFRLSSFSRALSIIFPQNFQLSFLLRTSNPRFFFELSTVVPLRASSFYSHMCPCCDCLLCFPRL